MVILNLTTDDLHRTFDHDDGTVDYCILDQVYHRFGPGEGHPLIEECHRVIQPVLGRLLVTVPNTQVLAKRWTLRQIDNEFYMAHLYGTPPDRQHRWGYTYQSLKADLDAAVMWRSIKPFNFRPIPGVDLMHDFWVLGAEAMR